MPIYKKGIENFNSKVKDRVGVSYKMKNNMKATCIKYNSADNIDVQFEDGYVATFKSWKNFKNGNILNPNVKYAEYKTRNGRNAKSYYIGKTYIYNCDQVKIVDYISYHNVIVVDSNNCTHAVSIDVLKRGKNAIACQVSHIGERKQMKNGLFATIIAYRNCNDIDVEFEDGTIREHRQYSSFNKGGISKESYSHGSVCQSKPICQSNRIGEKKQMKNGLFATIIAYRNCNDIDVEFEDGTIREHRRYSNFNEGSIPKKSYSHESVCQSKSIRQSNHIGEKKQMKNGLFATIIAYRNYNDIDVEFEDGTIREHRRYSNFNEGSIPICSQRNLTPKAECVNIPRLEKGHRLGQTAIMSNGISATIIRYFNANNIDIKWDNGIITEHCRYNNFIAGAIRCTPKKNQDGTRTNRKVDRINEKRMMNCGLYATIIKYINCKDLDVQFEDGYIAEHVKYQTFMHGRVYNPNTYGTLGVSRNEYALQCILQPFGFAKAEQGSLKELGFGQCELDLYNPNLNGHKVGIEYDGGSLYKGRGHSVLRDKRKNKLCVNAGITLIRIREPQLEDLNDTSIDFKMTSAEILSQNFIDTIKAVIAFLNKSFKASISSDILYDRNKMLVDFKNKFCFPNYYRKKTSSLKESRISEVNTMNCGMDAMIISYKNRDDINIEFEDGSIRKHVKYGAFKNGSIAHLG